MGSIASCVPMYLCGDCGLCDATGSVSAGELFDKIINKQKFTENQARGLFHQIMLGLDYLHSKGIAHRYEHVVRV